MLSSYCTFPQQSDSLCATTRLGATHCTCGSCAYLLQSNKQVASGLRHAGARLLVDCAPNALDDLEEEGRAVGNLPVEIVHERKTPAVKAATNSHVRVTAWLSGSAGAEEDSSNRCRLYEMHASPVLHGVNLKHPLPRANLEEHALVIAVSEDAEIFALLCIFGAEGVLAQTRAKCLVVLRSREALAMNGENESCETEVGEGEWMVAMQSDKLVVG
eukprot:6122547-Pleurochrysis_carterae.AAC.2